MRAVVFAYHNVGVRCIQVLLARGIEIPLVVTHEDNPAETIWFESVADLCREKDIPFITPADASSALLQKQVESARPDFLFSFYYRNMLPPALLNLHGSLLPKYRGRVPVNWAVLHGETETGATLHEMTVKPDAGDIIGQTAVPILPDDTAYQVFGKLTVAAEQTLWRVLPEMLAGRTPHAPNDLSKGSYFGGRKPEDGRIDWSRPAQEIYNLHRAVAPPYPGAWTVIGDHRLVLGKARLDTRKTRDLPPGLAVVDNCMLGVCGDRYALQIRELQVDGTVVTPAGLRSLLARSRNTL
jgi:methionyl-tRNA formyltransferase